MRTKKGTKRSTDLMFKNTDGRKSDKTNLRELRETYRALVLKYERDTHELRTKILSLTSTSD